MSYEFKKMTQQEAEQIGRAIKVYERSGFREVNRIFMRTNGSEYEFIKMNKML